MILTEENRGVGQPYPRRASRAIQVRRAGSRSDLSHLNRPGLSTTSRISFRSSTALYLSDHSIEKAVQAYGFIRLIVTCSYTVL